MSGSLLRGCRGLHGVLGDMKCWGLNGVVPDFRALFGRTILIPRIYLCSTHSGSPYHDKLLDKSEFRRKSHVKSSNSALEAADL